MEVLCEKYGKGKVFCVLFLSSAFLLVLMVAISFFVSRTVTYQGDRFRISEQTVNRVVLVAADGRELIGERSDGISRNLTIHTTTGTIKHEFKRTGPWNTLAGHGWVFTFENGETAITSCSSNLGCRVETTHHGTDEWRLYQSIRNRYFVFEDASIQFILIPFFGFFLIALGIGQIVYAEGFWAFRHMFSVKNGEPTEFAIEMYRLSGYVTLGIVLIGSLIIYYMFAWR